MSMETEIKKQLRCPMCGRFTRKGSMIWNNYEKQDPMQCFDCYNVFKDNWLNRVDVNYSPLLPPNNWRYLIDGTMHKVRDEIFNILRVKGVSLSQGIDIANSLIVHSRENKIPLELGLGIMKQESAFSVNAISNKGAIGLMQLMPATFDNYNRNLKMGLTRQASFDPVVNVRIALLHLKDIYEELKTTTKKEDELWKRVLNAYSGGAKNYPEAVRRYQKEFEIKLRDGEI